MSEPFSPAISERICKHMNDDHPEAVALYASAFGKAEAVEAARMLSIDAEGMNIVVEAHGASVPLRIPFERSLKDAEDAHHTLIDMLKLARTQATKA